MFLQSLIASSGYQAPFRIERHPSVWETLGDGTDRFNLLLPVKTPPFNLKSADPLIFMSRLG